ncbi:TPA: hypothetical protein ACMDNL_003697, partial [Vibrio cholerae]
QLLCLSLVVMRCQPLRRALTVLINYTEGSFKVDVNSYITPIAGLIGGMVSIVTFLITFQQLKNIKGEKAKELHSRYSAIKELAKDIHANYPEILILLSGLTRAELTMREVQWFINEPGAFLKLEQYGKICGRYCQIDLEKGEFSLTERVSTVNKRLIEKLKIIGVGLGLMAFLSAMWGVIIYNVNSATVVYIALGAWSVYLLLILWGSNLLWSTIDKAVKIQGKPIKDS